ncbi:MAG: helix-turn-helix domain-containing protein [Butyricicoccus sp.]
MLSENLTALRRMKKLSQEQVAEQVGVSRQALAKWESGETIPDVQRCVALAKLYEVSLDDLVNYSEKTTGLPIPPRGKHLFGTVVMGEKGQIVIPKRARDVFHLRAGDRLVVLGDEDQGIALLRESDLMELLRGLEQGRG